MPLRQIAEGQKPDGTFEPIQLDSSGNVKTTGGGGGGASSSEVKITDGAQTATITDVAGKKALDVNIADITLNKDNDSVTSQSFEEKKLIDEVSESLTYIGSAAPGTSTSLSAWKISRLQITGSITALEFADGNKQYDNVWDNRASLSYS